MTITTGELASKLGAALEGDPTRTIRGVATIEEATADDLSWVGDPNYASKALHSKAAALLAPPDVALSAEQVVIRVDDPDLALCEVLRILAPPPAGVTPGVDPAANVDPSAVIDPTAGIGPRVFVGPKATIGAGSQLHAGVYVGGETRVGADCVLWPNVVVRERVTLGDRVIVHPNATIGADGFGYLQRGGRHVKIPQVGTVVIEDDVEIGANSCVDRARSGETRICAGTKLDNHVQVGHNVTIGRHCILISHVMLGGSAKLGDHVILAGDAGVSDHVEICSNVMITAKSAAVRNIREPGVYSGFPAEERIKNLRSRAALRKLPRWINELKDLKKAWRDNKASP